MTTYPPQTIKLSHRIVKPAKNVERVQSVNPLVPVLLGVGSLIARMLMKLGFIVLFFTQFGMSINVRYGRYILTFADMPILGVDFSGTLFGSFIVVNSPFGWE